jgi:hypothetical protein
MKLRLLLLGLAGVSLAGCASYQGGSDEHYHYGTGTSAGPTASPTFRPGMNPRDIRDPNALTSPAPPGVYAP